MEKSNRKLALVEQAGHLRGHQINWNQVFYFSRIASVGSIKGAAEELGLSPSTLSLHLSQLEAGLHVQLFQREHRKLNLTPEGARLFQHAKAMFESGQRLLDVVSPLPLGCYPLSVGLVPSPSIQAANRILGRYLKSQRGLSLKIFRSGYGELEEGLGESRFDFGFSDRMPERKDLASQLVSNSWIQFFVAPRLAGIPFSRLLEELPLLICNAEPERRSFAEQALLESELSPSSVVTSDYPSALLELCQQGAGIGVFSEMTFRGQSSIQGLSSLKAPKDAPKLKDSLYVLWSMDAENSFAVRALRQVLSSKEVKTYFLGASHGSR